MKKMKRNLALVLAALIVCTSVVPSAVYAHHSSTQHTTTACVSKCKHHKYGTCTTRKKCNKKHCHTTGTSAYTHH